MIRLCEERVEFGIVKVGFLGWKPESTLSGEFGLINNWESVRQARGMLTGTPA